MSIANQPTQTAKTDIPMQVTEEEYLAVTPVLPDADGVYQTPLLPSFKLHVPTLWTSPLPTISQIVTMTKAMLAE